MRPTKKTDQTPSAPAVCAPHPDADTPSLPSAAVCAPLLPDVPDGDTPSSPDAAPHPFVDAVVLVQNGKTISEPVSDNVQVHPLVGRDLRASRAQGYPLDVQQILRALKTRFPKCVFTFRSKAFPLALLLILLAPFFPARAADAVEPASVSFNCFRGEAITAAAQSYFFESTTLRLTNCVAWSGTTTNSARQGLASVAVEVKVGTLSSNVAYSGVVEVATNGTFGCDITVPTNMASVFLQIKLTDSSTNVFIYPWKVLNISRPL